jgi:poly-beta-1,6-N-acetyl-D-glucosamine synthase
MTSSRSYVIISPAKDESNYIEFTLKSVLDQSVQPLCWIIVDDGSSDSTPEIVERYRQKHPWIRLLRLGRAEERNPGPAGVRAFVAGVAALPQVEYDYLVKLDVDLELPVDYFERLLEQFEGNPRLGITSGAYLENWRGTWEVITSPDYHAVGASKVMRRQCYEDFGGFSPTLGWDTLDEVRAQMHGWNTCHFKDIQFKHLRLEGTGRGLLQTHRDNGETDYLLGVGVGFFSLKFCQRLLIWQRPLALRALALLWGYLSSACRRAPRIATREESGFYRSQLNSRIVTALRQAFSVKLLRGRDIILSLRD